MGFFFFVHLPKMFHLGFIYKEGMQIMKGNKVLIGEVECSLQSKRRHSEGTDWRPIHDDMSQPSPRVWNN